MSKKPTPIALTLVLALILFLGWVGFPALKPSAREATDALKGVPSSLNAGNSKKTLIWAGISGQSPRYIDSGSNRGLGWIEYETREVRRALERAGFHLKMEYMTPARIEHEFRSKNPICFYPVDWANPKTAFTRHPDRILSLTFNLVGDTSRSILIRRQDIQHFDPFRDAKGNINLEALLLKSNLKTLLIEDEDYGDLSKRLFEKTTNGENTLRQEYRKNVIVKLIKQNQQLIEMLNASRFDYILSQAVEPETFESARLDRERFQELIYETSSIRSLDDPNLIRQSVACSVHPLGYDVIPVINQTLQQVRSYFWRLNASEYHAKWDSGFKFHDFNNISTRFIASFKNPNDTDSVDHWYLDQQKLFPNLKLYPEKVVEMESKIEPRPTSKLPWIGLRTKSGSWTLMTQAEAWILFATDLHRNHHHIYSRNNLARYLPPAVREAYKSHDPSFHRERGGLEQLLQSFREAPSALTVFGAQVNAAELSALTKVINTPVLKNLSLFDFSPAQLSELVRALPSQVEELNFSNSSLSESNLIQKLSSLRIKSLILNSSQVPEDQFLPLLEALPQDLRRLELGYNRENWSHEAAVAFGKRRLTSLRVLDLEANFLDDEDFLEIKKAIPSGIESLSLGDNAVTARGISALNFKTYLGLRKLDLHGNQVVSEKFGELRFPENLAELNLSNCSLDPGLLKLLHFPKGLTHFLLASDRRENGSGKASEEDLEKSLLPVLNQSNRLKALDLSGWQISRSLATAIGSHEELSVLRLKQVGFDLNGLTALRFVRLKKLDELDLSENRIDNEGALWLAKSLPQRIGSLSLSGNPIGREGLKELSPVLPITLTKLSLADLAEFDPKSIDLPSELRFLDLGKNLLGDEDSKTLGPHFPKGLLELSMEGSQFTTVGMESLSEFLPPGLNLLNLQNSQLGEDGPTALARRMPPALSWLSLGATSLNLNQAVELGKNLPTHLNVLELYNLSMPPFALGAILRGLPKSLQGIYLMGVAFDLAAGKSLSLAYPPHLREIRFIGITGNDRDLAAVALGIPNTLESLWIQGPNAPEITPTKLAEAKLDHLYRFGFFGPTSSKAWQVWQKKKRRFVISALVNTGLKEAAIGAVSKNYLCRVKALYTGGEGLSSRSILKLLKSLHPRASILAFPSAGIQLGALPHILKALPKSLQSLDLEGNDYGEAGKELVRQHIENMRKTAGVRLDVTE